MRGRRLMIVLLLAVMALAFVPAWPAWGAEPAVEVGAEPVAEDVPAQIGVRVRVVGPDASGGESQWAREEVTLTEGQSAWQATTEALGEAGLSYQPLVDAAGESLASLARPADGVTFGPGATSADGWRLIVNGTLWTGVASAYQPEEGDELLWYYHLSRTHVVVSAVGPGGTGEVFWLDPTTCEVEPGESAWDVCLAALEAGGYHDGSTLYYGVDEQGNVTLGSLSSLGPNGITGESWQLFVNGAPAQENVAALSLHDGDDLCWYYANVGDTSLPSFASARIAQAKRAGANRIEGRVYVAWGRRLASYLPQVNMAVARPSLRVVGDRVEIVFGDATVELSRDTGSVLSVDETDAAVGSRGEGLLGGLAAAGGMRGLVPLAPREAEDSPAWAWGPDGSFYYIEATGVVYRLVTS